MNAEQRQRASQLVRSQTEEEAIGEAFALLQELIDAPEPEPIAYQVRNGWVNVAIYQRQIDADNYAKDQQKRHDLSGSLAHFCVVPLYTAPPAPSVPVLTVECEPDYWSGGHYHEGTKPHIDPTAVWKLPIGTELYTSPPAPSVPEPAAKVLHVDGLLSNNLIDCDLPVGTLLYTAPAAPERDLLGPADEIVKRYNAYPKLLQLISDARDELVQLSFCEAGLDELIEELTKARE